MHLLATYPNSTGIAMLIRGYLRASTQVHNAERAREQLEVFAIEQGQTVASTVQDVKKNGTLSSLSL